MSTSAKKKDSYQKLYSRRDLLKGIALTGLGAGVAGLLSGIKISEAAVDITKPAIVSQFSQIGDASIVVFKDSSSKVYAIDKGGVTGQIGKLIASGTDATSVLQQAISALGSNGGIIHVKQGTYSVNALDLPSYVTLVGENRNSTILTATSSVPYVVSMKNGGIHLSQLFIDANGLATKGIDASKTTSSSTFSSIHRCYIRNATSVNIDLTNNEDIHLLDTIIDTGPTGCMISGSNGIQLFIKVLMENHTQQDLLINGNTSVYWDSLIMNSANVANANIYVTGSATGPTLAGRNLWANNNNGKRNVHKDSTQGGTLYINHANLYVGAAPTGQKNIGGTWGTLWAEALIVNLGEDVSQSLRYYFYNLGDTTIHTNLTFGA